MGRELSEAHIELLKAAGIDHVRLMLDGDAPGRAATAKLLPELAQRFFVKELRLPEQSKPHSAPEELLLPLLGLDGC
jgi:DNA primase